MSSKLSQARAWAGMLAVAGLIAALLLDQILRGVVLSDRNLSVFIMLISSLLGLDIVVERRQQIASALSGAIEGWLGATDGGSNDE